MSIYKSSFSGPSLFWLDYEHQSVCDVVEYCGHGPILLLARDDEFSARARGLLLIGAAIGRDEAKLMTEVALEGLLEASQRMRAAVYERRSA